MNKFGSQNVIGPTYDKYNNAKANRRFGIFLYLVKTNYFRVFLGETFFPKGFNCKGNCMKIKLLHIIYLYFQQKRLHGLVFYVLNKPASTFSLLITKFRNLTDF